MLGKRSKKVAVNPATERHCLALALALRSRNYATVAEVDAVEADLDDLFVAPAEARQSLLLAIAAKHSVRLELLRR